MKKILLSVIAVVLSLTVLFTMLLTAYADDYRYGVDVSHNNSTVNFTDIKKDKKTFVMIRLGYYTYLDKKFWDNVKAAYDADMDFGVYLYSYAESVDEARMEAEFVLNTLAQLGDYARNFTLPVAYDIEDNKIAPYGKAQITSQMTMFLDIIKAAGYTPMIYANDKWFNNYIDLNAARNYKIWYARWNSGAPESDVRIQIGNSGIYPDMWQYSDGGYNGLDQNVIYSPDDLIKSYTCIHLYDMSVIPPSCNYEGAHQGICSKCGYAFSTPIPKTAHSEVIDSAVNATYFASGKTQGSHCSVCGEVIVPQTNVAKKKASLKKLTAKKKAIAVSWGKVSSAKGYEIQYSTSKSFSKKTSKTKTIKSVKTVSSTLTKLQTKKKYYVRVRAYKTVNGKKAYSSWSTVKSVKVK